jgi:hypothetical protein
VPDFSLARACIDGDRLGSANSKRESVVYSESVSAYPARLKTARRLSRLFPWFAGLVLVAGIVAVVIVFAFRDSSSKTENATPVTPAQQAAPAPTPKQVPVPRAAKLVAGQFILTAVQRKHLDKAWKLAGPDIRGGLTYKQWLTGNIPVVPWLGTIGTAPLSVDYSYKNEIALTIVIAPKQGTKGHPDTFKMVLQPMGKGAKKHWVVQEWVPYEPPPIPANPVG